MNSLTLVFLHLLLASAFRLNSAGCPGCSSPVSDPNSGEIKKIMSSTLSQTNSGYSLTNVKSCTSQVVAGIKYDCELEIKSANGETSTCQLAVVHRPWDQANPMEIVKDTCSAVSRGKREVCAGCPVDQDVNDPELKNKLTGILSQTNSGLSLVNAKHCKSQVVAGTKWTCTLEVESPTTNGPQTCEISFWERPWISKQPEILSNTCDQLSRHKREICAGCPSELNDANSPDMQKKLSAVLGQTNSGLSLVRSVECTTQVVAGTRYVCKIQVESPKTNGVQTCEVSFMEQLWLSNEPTLLKDTCSQLVRNKREVCAGCPVDQDPSSKINKKLTGILAQTNSGLSFVRAKHCTSQVVAGIKYVCTLEVESPKINGPQTCEISYLEQPWLNPEPEVLSNTCANLVSEKKTVCAGCPIEHNPEDPAIQKKIVKSLSQSNSGLTLVGVEKCTSQVVAGALYDCTIRVGSSQFNGVETCEIKLLDQPWITKDPQIVYNTCSQLNNKVKREVGGLKNVDDSEKVLVQELSAYSVKTLDDIDADNNKRVVSQVISAQKQLVNGIMYHLKLLVRQTSCDEDKEENDECLEKDSAPPKICDIQVYRSFADKSPLNAKVVKSACEPAYVEQKKLGGYEPVQTNGDEVQKVADFATKRINQMVNSIYVKKIISVQKAATQVVSGLNYALTIELGDTDCMKNKVQENSKCKFLSNSKTNLVCNVVVNEKPWEKKLKMVSINCEDVPNVSVVRVRRAAVAGIEKVDVDSTNIKELNDFLSRKITESTNSPNLLRIIKFVSASQQIVSGVKYNLKVIVAWTQCPAAVNTNPDTCPVLVESSKQECDVVVLSQPWNKSKEVVSLSCHNNQEVKENIEDLNNMELKRIASMLDTTLDDIEFQQFCTFLGSYDKIYPSEAEYKKRFSIFRANMKKIKYLQETELGTGQYGATEFADLTKSEFKRHYLGFKKPDTNRWPNRPQAVIPNVTLPQAYDWRDYGVVTKVKNQGICGSCWAFSVTGNVEGQYAIQNKKLLSLSEQELVDCDKYDAGCNGGYFDSAFHALEDLGGLETETDYPYEGYDDKCRFNSSKVRVSITGSVNISSDETSMAKWLYKNGPISVALNANAMQFYMGGVSHPLKFLCSPDNLDHGVLIVGFGVHKTAILKRTLPYWIVKNSWGSRWGKQGYYWLYRGDGSCGINKMPTSAVL